MPELPVTLIKGDRKSKLVDYRDALPVNMYAVQKDILRAKGYMRQYPGLTKLYDGQGIDRGANYNERFNMQYRLSGESLISIDTDGTITILGTIPGSGQGRLQDFYSFNTQGVIANDSMYLYDATTGFREVTDTDLGNPIDGVWIDGYYFLTDGEYIYHTDLSDETAIDPLKFATAEFMPDPSLALSKTQDNKVMVWGRYSLEYFVNDATSNFSFSRVVTRAQKIGIVATHAKCEANGMYYIVGGRRNDSIGAYVVTLGQSERISTREIDLILQKYKEPELVDMRMESRTSGGVTLIIIHLPWETLCYNETIAKSFGVEYAWSLLKTDVVGNAPYRGINGVMDARLGKWIYGDRVDTSIGHIDEYVATHYGNKVEWILHSPLMFLEDMSIDKVEIETIAGYHALEDATVALSLTYDGEQYSQESWDLYSEPAKHSTRYIVRRLGIVDDIVGFKFRGVSTARMAFGLMRIEYG